MPTERKTRAVEELSGQFGESTIAISTDYTGMSVSAMTELRRVLRERGVLFRVVKNTIAHLAADAADRPAMKGIIEGPTGIAFGTGEPTEPAKALAEFIRATRSPLKIRGGVLADRALSAAEVNHLATLPSKDELVSRLLGQLNGPMARLVNVLDAPVSGLARVLQRRVEALQA